MGVEKTRYRTPVRAFRPPLSSGPTDCIAPPNNDPLSQSLFDLSECFSVLVLFASERMMYPLFLHFLLKGPGAYDVRKASSQCLKNAPAVAFGGAFNNVDREKTGPLKVLGEKEFVPGPCSYAVEAEQQVSACASSSLSKRRQNGIEFFEKKSARWGRSIFDIVCDN